MMTRMDAPAHGVAALGSAGGRLAAALVMLAAAVLWCSAALAAPVVELSSDGGHGRIVVSFPDRNALPDYRATSVNGVLVLQFEEEVTLDVSRAALVLGDYVTVARADPDGRGARFALARGVVVNTMEAGAQLFVDLLPGTWTGPPPPLPQSVIDELARRAEEATRIARQQELLRIAGANAARLDIQTAQGPTFSRVAFRWNIPFEAGFERRESGVLVRFDVAAEVDLGPARANLPAFVNDISAKATEDGGMSILLEISPNADIRAFREENSYVVDVQGPKETGTEDPAIAAIAAASGDPSVPADATQRIVSPGTGEGVSGHGPVRPAVRADGLKEAPADERPAMMTTPADALPPPRPLDVAAATPEPAEAAPVAGGDARSPAVSTAAASGPDPVGDPIADLIAEPPPTPAPVDPPAAVQTELPDGADARTLADGAIRVEAKRIGQATRVVFPYDHEVGAALFTRGPALWAVFDDPSVIEVAPLQEALAGYARSVEVFRAGDAQAVRVEMVEPLLATLNPDSTYWVVTIGNMVIEPTRPLPLRRITDDAGLARIDVPFGPVASILEIDDSKVGDRMIVVTGVGQPRGLIKPQSFAELDALSSAHGLAFVPRVDDIEATVDDQVVSLRRPSGLSLSLGAAPPRQTLLEVPGAGQGAGRPGQVDFTGTLAVDPPAFWKKRHELATAVAEAEEKGKLIEAWYDTAAFNVANGLGAEALGILALIRSKDSSEGASDTMAVLKAGADVMMDRPADALSELDRITLADSPDAAVWRAIAHTDLRDYAAAHRDFVKGEAVIDGFPETVRRRFLLGAVRTAIELNDFGKARRMIMQIDPAQLTPRELSELDILNARTLDASGLPVEAVDILSGVVRTGRGAPAAEATYRLVRMQRREGLITLEQAVERLERLAISWRGDQTELDVLRTLGQMTIEAGDYRRAFEVMRAAMVVAPVSDTTRMMNEEMQSAFSDLFLDGGADRMNPIEALALYYDFRELTPPGRRGDAMVRRLADRLVDVDLLPQAAELLSHQVENRLRGAARAEVAADLAMVYLMDRKPEMALRAIARTRQPELPLAVERQRRVVEGKALAETGKPDLALDLLAPLKGGDIDSLRADILWDANRHLAAGEAFERLLGARWSDDLPLTEAEQVDALKAGISYNLAADRLSIDRLRSKFGAKMGRTPSAVAFETVTAPISTAGSNFDEVVRSIASIDRAEAFLQDYRTRFRPGESQDGEGPSDPAVDAAPTVSAEPMAGGDPATSAGMAGQPASPAG